MCWLAAIAWFGPQEGLPASEPQHRCSSPDPDIPDFQNTCWSLRPWESCGGSSSSTTRIVQPISSMQSMLTRAGGSDKGEGREEKTGVRVEDHDINNVVILRIPMPEWPDMTRSAGTNQQHMVSQGCADLATCK